MRVTNQPFVYDVRNSNYNLQLLSNTLYWLTLLLFADEAKISFRCVSIISDGGNIKLCCSIAFKFPHRPPIVSRD